MNQFILKRWVKRLKTFLKYAKAFELGYQSVLEYRVNFCLSLVSIIFPITIQYFLWTSVFQNSTSDTVYGYSYSHMITYVILAGIVSRMVSTGFEWEISGDVKNGDLNKYLVKPIGYYQYRISCFLGGKAAYLMILSIFTAVIMVLISRFFGFKITHYRILLFIVSVVLGTIVNYCIVFCVSTCAFWLNEVWGIFIAMGLTVNLLSGGLFPIEVFGKGLVRVFQFLPFQYTISFPINVVIGKLPMATAGQGIAIQILWILILTLLSHFLWQLGMKKYVAIGG